MTTPPMKRPSNEYLDARLGISSPVLDHGFIRVVDYMGDEAAIVQAARVSYGEGTTTPSSDFSLIRYLMRHKHSSPLEMTEIKLHIKLPIFVARQWLRHRTANVNEYSARYSILQNEFYMPDVWHTQSTTNKQGSGSPVAPDDAPTADISEFFKSAADMYSYLLNAGAGAFEGIAREEARIVLPLATYTEMYWKIDLHNLLHFLRLRMDSHAQKEIRDYADCIFQIIAGWMPNVAKAFEDYVLNAFTFSGPEIEMLRGYLNGLHVSMCDILLGSETGKFPGSKREGKAFAKALGLEAEGV